MLNINGEFITIVINVPYVLLKVFVCNRDINIDDIKIDSLFGEMATIKGTWRFNDTVDISNTISFKGFCQNVDWTYEEIFVANG